VYVRTSVARALRASAHSSVSRHVLTWMLAAAAAGLIWSDAASAARQPHAAASRTDAVASKAKQAAAPHAKKAGAKAKHGRATADKIVPLPQSRPALADLPPGLAPVRQAFDLIRAGKLQEATAIEKSLTDPVAQTLVEWMLLRRGDTAAGFDRYAAFIKANPDWPGLIALRRRAEGRLWQERRDAATVRAFVGTQPAGVMGQLTLARVLMNEGDRAGAEENLRAAWRSGDFSAETEAAVIEAFPDVLTRADRTARMDRRIGAKDFAAAMRAAKKLGDGEIAIVKACIAAEGNEKKAGGLLDGVPGDARDDIGYALCRIHWRMHQNDVAGAARLMLAIPHDAVDRLDADEWWRERRVLARKLLDVGDAKTAYQVVRQAAPPANRYYRAERHFMAGWIAFRFLSDPETARTHFARIDEGTADPIVLARAAYWRGRAAETLGDVKEMLDQYQAAARHPTAYYGQLARTQLGLGPIELRTPPSDPVAKGIAGDLLRAAEMLYAIGERDVAQTFATDLADCSNDTATLAAIAKLARSHDDARTMLAVGKTALTHGHALEMYAFPDIGIPRYASIGPELDRSVVFSVVRTESAFDQRDFSPAKAVGLMQVTPEAGRDTAKRFAVGYDWKRLVTDPVYNTQMGAAEIAALLKEYRGSFIMTFAGYNAGRGRVQEWVARYGDPRDGKVDAVDWVERIPFAETRNYVQRVMENLAVYRVRFGATAVSGGPDAKGVERVHSRTEEAAARPQP